MAMAPIQSHFANPPQPPPPSQEVAADDYDSNDLFVLPPNAQNMQVSIQGQITSIGGSFGICNYDIYIPRHLMATCTLQVGLPVHILAIPHVSGRNKWRATHIIPLVSIGQPPQDQQPPEEPAPVSTFTGEVTSTGAGFSIANNDIFLPSSLYDGRCLPEKTVVRVQCIPRATGRNKWRAISLEKISSPPSKSSDDGTAANPDDTNVSVDAGGETGTDANPTATEANDDIHSSSFEAVIVGIDGIEVSSSHDDTGKHTSKSLASGGGGGGGDHGDGDGDGDGDGEDEEIGTTAGAGDKSPTANVDGGAGAGAGVGSGTAKAATTPSSGSNSAPNKSSSSRSRNRRRSGSNMPLLQPDFMGIAAASSSKSAAYMRSRAHTDAVHTMFQAFPRFYSNQLPPSSAAFDAAAAHYYMNAAATAASLGMAIPSSPLAAHTTAPAHPYTTIPAYYAAALPSGGYEYFPTTATAEFVQVPPQQQHQHPLSYHQSYSTSNVNNTPSGGVTTAETDVGTGAGDAATGSLDTNNNNNESNNGSDSNSNNNNSNNNSNNNNNSSSSSSSNNNNNNTTTATSGSSRFHSSTSAANGVRVICGVITSSGPSFSVVNHDVYVPGFLLSSIPQVVEGRTWLRLAVCPVRSGRNKWRALSAEDVTALVEASGSTFQAAYPLWEMAAGGGGAGGGGGGLPNNNNNNMAMLAAQANSPHLSSSPLLSPPSPLGTPQHMGSPFQPVQSQQQLDGSSPLMVPGMMPMQFYQSPAGASGMMPPYPPAGPPSEMYHAHPYATAPMDAAMMHHQAQAQAHAHAMQQQQ